MRTKSIKKIEQEIPNAAVPWLRNQTVNRITKNTSPKNKHIRPEARSKITVQLTPSSMFKKKRAIVKMLKLENTIFIKFVRTCNSTDGKRLIGQTSVGSVAEESALRTAFPSVPQVTSGIIAEQKSHSEAAFISDKLLYETNSLHNSEMIDLTEICFNTKVSDTNWVLRKFLGLPVPTVESELAAWTDDTEKMRYSPVRANLGTERLSMQSGNQKST